MESTYGHVARIRLGQRRRLLGFGVAVAVAAPLFAGSTSASGATGSVENASVVSDWNAIALSTLAGDTTKHPNESFLYMGFVHAAIYDAVVGVKGRYEPYSFDRRAPRGTSATAAAASAGHKILETYSPYAQAALDAALDNVCVIRDHPRPAPVHIASEQPKVERFIIRDRVHANVSKDLTGPPLDLPQARKVRDIGIAKRHRIAHAVLHNQDGSGSKNGCRTSGLSGALA